MDNAGDAPPGAYQVLALGNAEIRELEARREGTAIQGALFHELSAQNTLDGGPAKDSGFLDGFIVSAGDVLDECIRHFFGAPSV